MQCNSMISHCSVRLGNDNSYSISVSKFRQRNIKLHCLDMTVLRQSNGRVIEQSSRLLLLHPTACDVKEPPTFQYEVENSLKDRLMHQILVRLPALEPKCEIEGG
jgi:hypothetical protein